MICIFEYFPYNRGADTVEVRCRYLIANTCDEKSFENLTHHVVDESLKNNDRFMHFFLYSCLFFLYHRFSSKYVLHVYICTNGI